MFFLHYFHFFTFSLCIYCFSIFCYVFYYGDKLWSSYNEEIGKEYDFIIVGAGTAGSLIADRISKETNYSFILLEAGGHSNMFLDIPVLGPLLFGSEYDWAYKTQPQKAACLAMENNRCHMPQGKIVGGSSKINNMVHVRGNISHYIDWFHGKFSEKFILDQFDYIEKHFLRLDKIRYHSKLADSIVDAAKEIGYQIFNEMQIFGNGFMKSLLWQNNGKRYSTADHIVNSQHLKTHAFVKKVLIDNNIAQGVTVSKNSRIFQIMAKKSVILCAGTINSPKILQLSGIGPRDELGKLNISVVKDSPVGANLQDHVTTGLDLIKFNTSLNISPMDMLKPLNILNYFINGKGPFTSPGCEVVGFLSSSTGNPDLQFMVLPVGITSDKGSGLSKNMGIKKDVWNNYFAKVVNDQTASILPIVLHPRSRGNVIITSKNPFDPPQLNPNYLSDVEDVQKLVKGLMLIEKILKTKAMQKLGASFNENKFPGCDFPLFTRAYWECYVRHMTLSVYHPVGTCSMGLENDANSVVDTSFQVIGVRNLYVADASVLPSLPSGNINAAVALMSSLFFEINIANKNKSYCRRKTFLEYYVDICIKT